MEVIDEIKYREEVYEISLRNGSIEINNARNNINGQRILNDNNILIITSSNSDPKYYKQYMSWARNISKKIRLREKIKWFHKEYYKGSVTVGSDDGIEPLIELVKYTYKQLLDKGLKSEVIGIFKKIHREHKIIIDNGEAVEDRILYELYIYPYTIHYGRVLSSSKLIGDNNVKGLYNKLDKGLDDIYRDIILKSRSKRLNPVYTGKWNVILTKESAPVIYHEIIHLLQGDEPFKLPLGYRFEADITIIEDPFYRGPLQRLFDDEVYPAWKRTLVEKGLVIDYLHTRTTVYEGIRPGNARGLFTRSKPLHYQLIIKPGDWSIEEMIIESRKSIIVESIAEAHIHSRYIRIIPETCLVSKKDRVEPVFVGEILIPIDKLNQIFIGTSKNIFNRYTFEKGFEVYEEAPATLIYGRVLV